MDNNMLIEVTNQRAIGLLRKLKELKLIKVLKKNFPANSSKLSDKYNGAITKEQGQNLNENIKKMRGEWNSI